MGESVKGEGGVKFNDLGNHIYLHHLEKWLPLHSFEINILYKNVCLP